MSYGLVIGLLAGGCGGILAAVAGVGGGLIYVPLFYLLIPLIDDTPVRMALVMFASLVAVAITGLFSARAHWRLGHVDLQVIRLLLPGLWLGAMVGLWSTLQLPEVLVLLALAGLNGWIANDYHGAIVEARMTRRHLPWIALLIGGSSGLLGIGGGTMMVPLLRRLVALRIAVGSSALAGALMALGAVAGNLMLEPAWRTLLISHASLLGALWLAILAVLPLSTRWGAKLHVRYSEQQMRWGLRGLFALLAGGYLLALLLRLSS